MKQSTENENTYYPECIKEVDHDRDALEKMYGAVYDTKGLMENFEVIQFSAPLVLVKRKSDNVQGTMYFQHMPRFYFSFKEI